MTVGTVDASRCPNCGCVRARDNVERLCSPCAARSGRERWLRPIAPAADFDFDDLRAVGAYVLMARHTLTAEHLIDILLDNGMLPGRNRRYRLALVALLGMRGVSHSAAARQLDVTRWTVATWRERLFIDEGP